MTCSYGIDAADDLLDCTKILYAARDCVSTTMGLTPADVPVMINSPDLSVIGADVC